MKVSVVGACVVLVVVDTVQREGVVCVCVCMEETVTVINC